MPQPPGNQGCCHLSSDEALALGKEGRGPAFHPLPAQILHTPFHLRGPGPQQWPVHRTLNDCGSDHIWLLHCVYSGNVGRGLCGAGPHLPGQVGKMSGFAHKWEKGNSSQGHRLLFEPPRAPPHLGKRDSSSVLCLTSLTSLNACHQLSPPSLSKQHRLLPHPSSKQT